jgi:deoxycytidylate deaminase
MQRDFFGNRESSARYLKSAVAKLYSDDDEFIVLGLTGRTGSGCSTAATLLQSEAREVKHSLFSGEDPASNEQRKERILLKYFEHAWRPFILIQVRSIITTFLLEEDPSVRTPFLENLIPSAMELHNFQELLEEMRQGYLRSQREIDSGFDIVKYYSTELPAQCERLRELIGESEFVMLYQEVGKNIRLSGRPFESQLEEGQFFTLAERIDKVIEALKAQRMREGRETFIVIDAIRNPLEAIFFQDRYTSFFLLAVSAPEEDRIARLRTRRFSEEDIRRIDQAENTAHQLGEPEFYSVQDIPSCLQRADLYVSNPETASKVNQFQSLANQLIKFVALIRRPGVVTPSSMERCMQMAYTAKLNSGCISRQVGAVVTDEGFSVRSVGWNDAPFGQVPCNLRNREDLLGGRDSTAYSEFEKTNEPYLATFRERSLKFVPIAAGGRNNSFCFKTEYNSFTKEKNQVHTRSLHAEENAFLQIAKYGLGAIEGGNLFTTASPCELCAKKAYQLGIVGIYYIDPYPGIAVSHILRGGSNNPKMILFSGAIGRAFHRLYTPIVAYKDELNALVQ